MSTRDETKRTEMHLYSTNGDGGAKVTASGIRLPPHSSFATSIYKYYTLPYTSPPWFYCCGSNVTAIHTATVVTTTVVIVFVVTHVSLSRTAAATAAKAGSSRPRRPRTMRRLYCCACMYMPVLRCKQAPCSTTVRCERRRLQQRRSVATATHP